VADEIFELLDGGDTAAVRMLLERRPEAALARDEEGLTAVRHAAYRSPELLAAVLAADPPLDAFDAALVGEVDRLGDPDAWSEDGFTALHLAVFGRQVETVQVLLDRGADPEALARHADPNLRVRPLHTATAFGGDVATARALLHGGADPNGRSASGSTPLHNAAQVGNRELVELLLERGADPAIALADGRTAADLAADEELAARLRA
jgi:ankyrin repeat protein